MASDESVANVDDILRQYGDEDVGDLSGGQIHIDDLLQMDVEKVMNDPEVEATTPTPNGNDRELTPSRPQLNSTLPKPVAPELPRPDDIAPDLPSTVSRFSHPATSPLSVSSPTSDQELDIESILRNTDTGAADDPLLDFDPTMVRFLAMPSMISLHCLWARVC